MPGTPTPILGLVVPTVGGDTGAWGTEINGDLAILDSLGAANVYNVSSNFTAVTGVFPEVIIRCTTGPTNISVTLPTPGSCSGKIFFIKKIDSGLGNVVITPVSGTIDGNANWVLVNQYSFVRIGSNGVTFDVLGTL